MPAQIKKKRSARRRAGRTGRETGGNGSAETPGGVSFSVFGKTGGKKREKGAEFPAEPPIFCGFSVAPAIGI